MTKRITKEVIDKFYESLTACRICPRKCKVNRLEGELGNCNAGSEVKISSYHQHFGEEPPLVGKYGSGTIFFTHCNLHCVYCQNYEISQLGMGQTTTPDKLHQMMLRLQELKCHNINLVTPTPWVPHIVKALAISQEKGLNIPVVYNCGGYESIETLRMLEGIVDIYMPDIKYAENRCAEKYSCAPDYWNIVQAALKEMHRQVGNLVVENGIAKRGLLIRHLVLPNNIAGSQRCFEFISKEISEYTVVNVMAQYYPTYHADDFPELNRRITTKEYREAREVLEKFGLDKGFQQTIDTIFRDVVPEWTDNLKDVN